jgi:hypothetical protein
MKNRVQQPTAAGRLTDRRSPQALWRSLTLAPLVALIVLLVGVAPAFAGSAWWHLTAQSRPGIMKAGSERDEVQTLRVTADGGEFVLLQKGLPAATVKFDATDAELRAALEGIYGAGDVEVTGGPGNLAGSSPYQVTFVGGLYDRQVEPIEVDRESVGGVELTCEGSPCPENVSAREVVESRPDGQVVVVAANLGDGSVDAEGVPVSVQAQLPAGFEAVGIKGSAGEEYGATSLFGSVHCSLASLSCTFVGMLPAYEQLVVIVSVVVKPGARSGEVARASVAGGETRRATVSHQVVLGEATPFGVESYELAPEAEGGGVDTQAGSHPFQLTTTLTFNQLLESNPGRGLQPVPVKLGKDLHFVLPPGLIGNPTPFPQCTVKQILTNGPSGVDDTLCPVQTVIGVARIDVSEPEFLGEKTQVLPLFNIEPFVGEPARFAFRYDNNPVYLDTAVRTGGDYGVTVDVNNITQIAGFIKSEVTFWGVPGSPSHDEQRGENCLRDPRHEDIGPCTPLGAHTPPPLIELPTSCTGPLQTSVEADSWAQPGVFVSSPETAPLPAMDGCNRLPFEPSITFAPDGQAGSTPTGLAVTVHVPQAVSLNGEALAEADVKNTTVALPEGVAVNPAGADGLQACSEEGIALHSAEPPTCPEASKIGTVKIKTPLLPNLLEGSAYLAAQNANPFGSLLALYVFVEDPVSGSRVKLAGEVVPNPVTGQLVSTFKNTPQLPFETFELHFFGGDRAPLATPARCGAYTTTASIEPWTETGEVHSSSTFDITSGPASLSEPGGSPCPGPSLPFSPSLTGGALNVNAGAFSPLDLTMTRKDGEQNLQSVEAHLPPGLSGILSNVELCPEPQANLGECGPNSLVGETTVSVGVGGDPFSVTGGKFYLTGPYNGSGGCTVSEPGCAPFGLTFEVPAKAGPFDLKRNTQNPAGEDACDCVIVRGKIEINPTTAAVTITSNPPGTPDAIPTSIEGIPLEIQHVNAITTRGDFQFNPTNCNKMEVTGTIHSSEGATDTLGVPFQVTNCAALKFTPKFTVSTSGKTSKANGASLTAKVTEPSEPFGSQANIHMVKVELPKQLPSRLTTLQKACTAAQFEANPAGCPTPSVIGHAKVITPLVPLPLEGPVYFVSHGGEAFPSLEIVLQGYNVKIVLVGATFISKAGITSTTFKTVPDQPFSSFELTLPEGPYSALAANGNLCTQKLTMPTEFIAQNGMETDQSTAISVTGCAKTKSLTRAQKLAKVLKACKKDKKKGKRQSCVKQARKKYGAVKKGKGKKK